MTIRMNLPVAPKSLGAKLSRRFFAHKTGLKTARQKRTNEGALLVEVLVGMFILVVVFTATTMALSAMANERVKVEQRDRALKLVASYDELSKAFKCGFVVDRIDDALATSGNGEVDFQTQIENCDFAANDDGNPLTMPENAGDQDFVKIESINETDTEQRFNVSIRYWWEFPGTSNHHLDDCNAMALKKDLPLILVRSIQVNYDERGVPRNVGVVKRDPVPNNNVVFASGNRVSVIVKRPSAVSAAQAWETEYYPYPTTSPDLRIKRIVDVDTDRIEGQPFECLVFPYITPDSNPIARSFKLPPDTTSTPVAVPLDQAALTFVKAYP